VFRRFSAESGLSIDGILGQNGFFDTHKMLFEKYKKRFDITPIARKKK
jgi:hypothetical protein